LWKFGSKKGRATKGPQFLCYFSHLKCEITSRNTVAIARGFFYFWKEIPSCIPIAPKIIYLQNKIIITNWQQISFFLPLLLHNIGRCRLSFLLLVFTPRLPRLTCFPKCQYKLSCVTGFLLMILWCHQSGNGIENNLAKFGYVIDMKVGKKNRILLYSWLPTGTYHKKIWQVEKKNFFKIWWIWVSFFFPWKILWIGWYHKFSGQNLVKFCQEKKHWLCVGAPQHRNYLEMNSHVLKTLNTWTHISSKMLHQMKTTLFCSSLFLVWRLKQVWWGLC
jgi:hypothetical protein